MVDKNQIMQEMRAVIERYPKFSNLEDATKNHAELQVEIQAICQRHGVPFQDWGGFEELKKQTAELSKKSFDDLKKRAAALDKPKPKL